MTTERVEKALECPNHKTLEETERRNIMRCVLCALLLLGLVATCCFADQNDEPVVTDIKVSCEKTSLCLGDPLSAKMVVTIAREDIDKKPKTVSFGPPGFVLTRRTKKSSGDFHQPVEVFFLPLAIEASTSDRRATCVKFGEGETVSTIDLVLLAQKTGHEPGRPGLTLFGPCFDAAGVYEISIKHRGSSTISNAVEVTVSENTDSDTAVRDLFYNRDHVRFVFAPWKWKERADGKKIAEKLVADFPEHQCAAYSRAALGLAKLWQAEQYPSPTKRQILLREALPLLQAAIDRLPADCPIVQECIVQMAKELSSQGEREESNRLWQRLIEKWPHSPFAPQATEALSRPAPARQK